MKNRQPAWKQQEKKENMYVNPIEVEVRDNDVVQALKILKHKMIIEGVLTELRNRRFAEKPSDKKRRKHREALKKARKSHGRRSHNGGR